MYTIIISELSENSPAVQVSYQIEDNMGNVNLASQAYAAVLSVAGSPAYIAAIIAAVIADAATFGFTITASQFVFPFSTPAESVLSLSLQTSTGAVGTQVSAARDAWVTIAGSTTTTATISGAASEDIIVEVAPTNSATAGDWVEKGRIGNSQTLSLALALSSVQVVKGQVTAFVPAGYYIKARTSGSGTVSAALISVRQVLL